MITFSPNDREKAITFNIVDDDIALEPPEIFQLFLEVVTITDRVTIQPNNRTIISIMDDDGMCVFLPLLHIFYSKRLYT